MQQPLMRELPAEYRPLLNKFYRSHRSHMRAPADACYWIAGAPEIVAALCLVNIDGGRWLTGVLVAPNYRGGGLATSLLSQALAACEGSVWLFCEPNLKPFYRQLGFSLALTLPESLASRLDRYNRHKTLEAMHYYSEITCPTES